MSTLDNGSSVSYTASMENAMQPRLNGREHPCRSSDLGGFRREWFGRARAARLHNEGRCTFFSWRVILAVFLVSFLCVAVSADETKISIHVFYAMDCEDCHRIITQFFPKVFLSYSGMLDVRYYELNRPENYEALVKIEEAWGDVHNEFPIVAVGQYLLDLEDVERELGKILEEYRGRGAAFHRSEFLEGTAYTSSPHWEAHEAFTETHIPKAIYLAYFYEIGCKQCDRAEYQIKYLESRYPEVEVRTFDMALTENKILAEALGMFTGVPEKKRMSTPVVFIGSDYLLAGDVTDRNLISLVEKYRTTESAPPWEEAGQYLEEAKTHIVSRFRSLELLTILSAGLLDGVNPCAFATLVFFISYLAFVIKRKADILVVGFAFVAAVFVTYFLIGIGLLSFIQSIGFMRLVGRIVYVGTAGVAILFGILSIHDYFRYSGGDYDKSLLRLPEFLRRRTHDVVRKKMDTEKYVAGAFATGFFISLLEFACTGQVYLPTIIFVTRIPALRAKGLLYLLVYNICFIVPLLAVFLLAYRGMTAERLFFLLRSRGKTVKLLTALMFFSLAGLLFYYLLS